MDDSSIVLVAALLGGLLAAAVRVPPLVGFLAAGFALSAAGVGVPEGLDTVADLGVTVLLFGVGLKVDVRALLRREVWLVTTVHTLGTTVVAALLLSLLGLAGIAAVASGGISTWLMIGFALSFSSTVLVVKVLEERNSGRSLSGRTAIGVLVVQDLVAVVFLATVEGRPPSPWAVSLVLLVPAAFVLRRVLASVGHDELLPLFGLVLALVPGYALFELVDLKGDLGALVMGALIAGAPRSGELAKSLFTLKDLLLVGFFVSIGMGGVPTATEWIVVLALLALLPLKALAYAGLFWLCRFRRRTAVLTGSALANFSEFGLIVVVAAPASLLDESWTTILGTTVALSFVITAAPIDRRENVVHALRGVLRDRPADRLHVDDQPLDVGDADALVLGMGRVGRAAYDRLRAEHGLRVLGIEGDRDRCHQLGATGYRVVEGDATDPELWADLPFHRVRMVLLAMPFHSSNLDVLERLRTSGYRGTVAVVAQFDEDLRQATDAGADAGFQLYDGAGAELADRAAAAEREL